MTKPLLSDVSIVRLSLAEGGEGGRVKVRGEFAKCGVATENKRVYPDKVWEKELKRLGKALKERRVMGEIDHPCLTSDDFRVFTATGWKPFADVKIGDRVWSRVDGNAVLSSVTGITNQPYEGPAFRLKSKGIDVGVTPDHRVLLVHRPDEGSVKEVYATAAEIAANPGRYAHSAIPLTASFPFTENPSEVTIPAVLDAGRTRNDVTQPLRMDSKLFSAFMGIYLSEGNVSTEETENYGIHLSQKTPWIREIIKTELLSKFPPELVWTEGPTGFFLSDARLYRYLQPLGDAYTKSVPAEVKNLGLECQRELLFWFTLGDGRLVADHAEDKPVDGRTTKEAHSQSLRENGSVDRARQAVFSVSKRLVTDLHEALVRTGGCGTVTRIDPSEDYAFAGRTIRAEDKVPLWNLAIKKSDKIWTDPRNVRLEPFDHKGSIFCLSVTHGNFFMEQNGQSFWTGNSDGQTKLSRVSHIITSLAVKDGLVIGEAEIMPTEAGKNLLALLKSNVPVGVSSRGFGSVKTNESGNDVVQDDYKLVTFDFVADPADQDAYPVMGESRSLFEGVEFDADTDQEKAIEFARRVEMEMVAKRGLPLEGDAAKAREFARRIEGEMGAKQGGTSLDVRDEFASVIIDNLSTIRAAVRSELRKEMMEDPEIGNAKTVLDALRGVLRPYLLPEDAAEIVRGKDAEIREMQKQLAERDLKLKDLESENNQLAEMAKEVGYRFYLEKMVSNDPDAASIRTLVGDLKSFESSDALKLRVTEVKAELDRKAAAKKAESDSKAKEVVEARQTERKQRDAVESKLAAMEKKMSAEKALRLDMEDDLIEAKRNAKDMETRLYAEERLANHPKAGKLRTLVESARPTSRKAVDALVESEREVVRDDDDLQSVRARIRGRMSGGSERVPAELSEDVPTPRTRRSSEGENWQGLGISLDRVRALAGIKS